MTNKCNMSSVLIAQLHIHKSRIEEVHACYELPGICVAFVQALLFPLLLQKLVVIKVCVSLYTAIDWRPVQFFRVFAQFVSHSDSK